jgi:hypothetical protein
MCCNCCGKHDPNAGFKYLYHYENVDEVFLIKGLDDSFVIEVYKEDDGDWVACCGIEYSPWEEQDND